MSMWKHKSRGNDKMTNKKIRIIMIKDFFMLLILKKQREIYRNPATTATSEVRKTATNPTIMKQEIGHKRKIENVRVFFTKAEKNKK